MDDTPTKKLKLDGKAGQGRHKRYYTGKKKRSKNVATPVAPDLFQSGDTVAVRRADKDHQLFLAFVVSKSSPSSFTVRYHDSNAPQAEVDVEDIFKVHRVSSDGRRPLQEKTFLCLCQWILFI